ncbi:MAG: hypothetical protein A3D95_12325 [Betaproteobacteria bacterium RIFCSPHIGHO2_12_FULL_69_13]|nr:MAG: hypothetical protein A3D95_12325 [Betaproteobacteria bacterium RIFCSPHIGHO2_12_FULL_69_13]OGA68436.1 MAG: hypothetical protein A3G83_14040 [Betaproteobacteria bacterium RIFCSPLOWO2_12_FULL_68_20]
MIKKLSRLLLSLAIAVAVPAQGAVALGSGLCMALGHHQALAAGAQDAAHAHGADHGLPEGGALHHGDQTGAASSHCGPCVACCAAASIPPSVDILSGLAPDAAVDAAFLVAPPDFLSDELNRPPLTLPA